jgi:Protein of unknown function (DUF2490)
MKKQLLLIFSILLIVSGTRSQTTKTTESTEQIWFGYFNQIRFNNKWGTWADLHLRTKEDFVNNFSQAIVRLGITYYINDATKFTIGYANVVYFPGDNHIKVTQPEHRPWQQLQWQMGFTKTRLMQSIRLEERYRRKIANDSTLGTGYHFNFRLRYNIWFNIPLSSKGLVPKTLSFVVNNDVHINFGKEIIYNYFDQNRFFIGFRYQFNEESNIQFGYMNIFQQLPAGNKYRSNNVARVFYFHNLDLRKKIVSQSP